MQPEKMFMLQRTFLYVKDVKSLFLALPCTLIKTLILLRAAYEGTLYVNSLAFAELEAIEVKELTIGATTSSLHQLQHLCDLIYLRVNRLRQSINVLEPLWTLTGLRHLYLTGIRVRYPPGGLSLEPLMYMTELQNLVIKGFVVMSLTPLCNLKRFRSLKLVCAF